MLPKIQCLHRLSKLSLAKFPLREARAGLLLNL